MSMLELVERRSEKARLQKRLESVLREALPNPPEMRDIGWRSGGERMRVFHNNDYWHTVKNDTGLKIPRYWNSFGRYDPDRAIKLVISVEINIATTSNDGRISAFFARDSDTDAVCLLHDGGVGGGKPGVSKNNFLHWLRPKLKSVTRSNGATRRGILITPLDSDRAGRNILRFVESVIEFKRAADSGFRGPKEEYDVDDDDYFDEPAGKRKRRRVRELEYESRHGDIVRALQEWRKKRIKVGEKITKSVLIDLGIKTQGVLSEIYEVKSGCSRSQIYGGVGQILVHEAPEGRSKRFLVLPDDDRLKPDLRRALDRNKIEVILFHMDGDDINIS
jgi:hypothetical protein